MRRKYSTVLIVLLGLLIFSSLNMLMVYTAPEVWTNKHVGPWSAFHKGFTFSGFDQYTYIAVSQFRPIYVHLRHPALLYFVYPMTWLNDWLKDEYGINCAIYIVAIVWTLIGTLSWTLLYKIFRKVIGLSLWESLLLNVFFYSFAHVTIAMFVPDHMLLTMTTLFFMLYLSGRAMQQGKAIATWKALLLYFIGTGISTTNAIKIWMIDIAGRWRRGMLASVLRHSLTYIIPTLLLAWIYYYQETTANIEEERFLKRIEAREMKKDSVRYNEKKTEMMKAIAVRENKQIIKSPLFQWTDMSIPIIPTLIENIYGEGFILHKDYLMHDANIEGQRPIIVKYSDWYNYVAEAVLVLLFIVGVFIGRKERFLCMCLLPFLFDMFLHVVLRFALTDVYIMTAHWAVVIPVAVAMTLKYAKAATGRHALPLYIGTLSAVGLLTIYMLWHNLSLMIPYMFTR